MTCNEPQPITLHACDGYALSAKRYPAVGRAVGNLLVASATGVPQRFYRRFAEFAASHGLNVLTLDYRGVGESAPSQLKGFAMHYLDWAEKDLAAAVDYLAQDPLPLYWVGHSYGGQVMGLLPNHDRLQACYTFGSGAGWAGWMPPLERFKVNLVWKVLMPPIVAAKGYMAWSLLGLGDDLPLGVYQSWRHWCQFPHYFFGDPERPDLAARAAQLRTPCLFAVAEDDAWAPPRSRDALIKGYPNTPLQTLDIPSPGSKAQIGHMGYFRPACSALWQDALDWLLAHAPAEQAEVCA